LGCKSSEERWVLAGKIRHKCCQIAVLGIGLDVAFIVATVLDHYFVLERCIQDAMQKASHHHMAG
jgi:hypothetical protein